MSTIDYNTLDPEQIRKLPVRRELPYSGLSEAQVRALGLDPAEVEEHRLSALEWQQQQSVNNEANLLAAAQEAVATGEMTYSEAALWLRDSGRQTAHDAFVQQWREEEAAERAEDAAFEVTALDAEGYAELVADADARERAQLKQETDALLAGQIKDRLDAAVPVNHPMRAGNEAAIIHQLTEAGDAPQDEAGQNTLIRGAVQRADVVGSAAVSLSAQAETEWRILRKTQGKTGTLMTQADIDTAKEHYINGRLKQLADSTMINHDDLKAPPTADEEQARYVERIGAENVRSTALHSAVGEIAERAREAEARRQGGTSYGTGAEQDRYRAAVRRAEENAHVGEATSAPQSRNPDRPDLPAEWADEFGPAGYSA
jgi:hypothetical protein